MPRPHGRRQKAIVCTTVQFRLRRFCFSKRISGLSRILRAGRGARCGYSGEMAKKRGGGPKSETGKASSSRNAITNGCQARKTRILADETQEDYDAVERGWNEEFGPETFMERRLVEILVDNDWFLQRTTRRLHEAETADGNIELMLRYKTTAERSFYRSLNALQQLRKHYMIIDRELQKKDKELAKRPPAPVEKPKGEAPKAEAALQCVGTGIQKGRRPIVQNLPFARCTRFP